MQEIYETTILTSRFGTTIIFRGGFPPKALLLFSWARAFCLMVSSSAMAGTVIGLNGVFIITWPKLFKNSIVITELFPEFFSQMRHHRR